jgi:heterodisulfide reductase subunit C
MMTTLPKETSQLSRDLQTLTGVDVTTCDLCEECTRSCPAAHAMRMKPHELVRAIQLGHSEEIHWSGAIWTCLSCESCNTCCPRGIHVLRLIDGLREMSKNFEYYNPYPAIPALHGIFLGLVKRYGKVHPLSLVLLNNLRMMTPFKDIDLASPMLLKRKFKLLPRKSRGTRELRRVVARVREIEKSFPDPSDGEERSKFN